MVYEKISTMIKGPMGDVGLQGTYGVVGVKGTTDLSDRAEHILDLVSKLNKAKESPLRNFFEVRKLQNQISNHPDEFPEYYL